MRYLAMLLLSLNCAIATSDDRQSASTSKRTHATTSPPNLAAPTFGGTQFWSDELVYHGWRIQRNVLTGHCRLLDEHDYRRAWGTFDSCLARFESQREKRELPAIDGKVVITLHGMGAWRTFISQTSDYLATEGGYTPINVTYASTRRSLDEHARSLAKVIERLDEATEINFVCHSMGNLVVRRYLALAASDPGGVDPRIGRMVMLGPPNQGATLARHFDGLRLYGWLLGPSGKQLAKDRSEIDSLFATPEFEFAIIAGNQGMNPFLAEQNDFVVTVNETKLAGASDFLELPLRHSQLTRDSRCQECVLRFLQAGVLVSEDNRQRLPAE